MKFSDLLGFDRFATPSLVKIAYWIGIVFILIGFLSSLFVFGQMGVFFVLMRLLFLVLGLLFWRVACEAVLLMFKMYDRMESIERLLASQRQDEAQN